MGELEMLTPLAQFGTAGLIGWMWLNERRSASSRERELSEAHEHIREQRVHIETLVRVVEENTRAIVLLESSQRALSTLVGTLRSVGGASSRDT